MQPNHEADELQDLLRKEYGAPPLDKQFSAGLLTRLQVEVSPVRLKSPVKSRRSLLAICVGVAAVAASIFAVLWILNRPDSSKVRESARRERTDFNHTTYENLDTMALESESARENERLESLSDQPRTLSLSESLREAMPEGQRPESESKSESKPYSEARTPRTEDLVREEHAPASLAQSTQMSVLSAAAKEWPSVTAAAARADMLYLVDNGRLYEVNRNGGLRRSVGDDHWQNSAAMAASGNYLYLVCDNQLYEVDPKTGVRRSIGKPEWASTKAILTVGDKLYIVSNGSLHKVSPSDGSHEVLRGKIESLNQSSKSK